MLSLIKNFIAFAQNHFNKTVKVIRSDNGTEFVNHDLSSHLLSLGIIHQTSCAYTPHQNWIVERKQQHLLNVVRSLRFQVHLTVSFWGDCILIAEHLINILPAQGLGFKSPHELLSFESLGACAT